MDSGLSAVRGVERALKRAYNDIAESWARLKTRPFPFVLDFIKSRSGFYFVEGCGAARHSSLVKPVVGVDFSFNMVKLAKERDPAGYYLVADVRALPFKSKVFDYGVSVAVLHHLRPDVGLTALLELRRVVRLECLLSVWSKEQERFRDSPKEVLVPFGGFERYYYLYARDEFVKLVSEVFSHSQLVPDMENIVLVVK